MRMRASLAVALLLTFMPGSLSAQDFLSGSGPAKKPRITQRLDQPLPLDLEFRNEAGETVELSRYFGDKPVIVSFVYYRCPMLCGMVLQGLVDSISNMKMSAGKDYTIVTVSFDPRETPAMAAGKKNVYIKRYGRAGAADGWHFLTGNEANIRKLLNAAGFQYEFDPKSGQFAHGATILVATPEGKISRYLYGIQYPSRDLRLALVEASENRIGSLTDQFLLLCYRYDTSTGKYSMAAMNAVRAGGVASVLILGSLIGLSIRKEKKKNRDRAESVTRK